MRYVSELTEAELITSEAAHNNHQTGRVRRRTHQPQRFSDVEYS